MPYPCSLCFKPTHGSQLFRAKLWYLRLSLDYFLTCRMFTDYIPISLSEYFLCAHSDSFSTLFSVLGGWIVQPASTGCFDLWLLIGFFGQWRIPEEIGRREKSEAKCLFPCPTPSVVTNNGLWYLTEGTAPIRWTSLSACSIPLFPFILSCLRSGN